MRDRDAVRHVRSVELRRVGVAEALELVLLARERRRVAGRVARRLVGESGVEVGHVGLTPEVGLVDGRVLLAVDLLKVERREKVGALDSSRNCPDRLGRIPSYIRRFMRGPHKRGV